MCFIGNNNTDSCSQCNRWTLSGSHGTLSPKQQTWFVYTFCLGGLTRFCLKLGRTWRSPPEYTLILKVSNWKKIPPLPSGLLPKSFPQTPDAASLEVAIGLPSLVEHSGHARECTQVDRQTDRQVGHPVVLFRLLKWCAGFKNRRKPQILGCFVRSVWCIDCCQDVTRI